jgi:hypothetical protein
MITLEEALRALGFTPEQIEEELLRSGSSGALECRTDPEPEPATEPWWAGLYPLTIEVGPNSVVPGFRPGDRIQLVLRKEAANGIVQLTPEDILAISNLIENGADYKPQSDAERVWRMILATLETFPGSRLLPS